MKTCVSGRFGRSEILIFCWQWRSDIYRSFRTKTIRWYFAWRWYPPRNAFFMCLIFCTIPLPTAYMRFWNIQSAVYPCILNRLLGTDSFALISMQLDFLGKVKLPSIDSIIKKWYISYKTQKLRPPKQRQSSSRSPCRWLFWCGIYNLKGRIRFDWPFGKCDHPCL